MLEKLLFKKIEMWVLIAVLILGSIASVTFGYLVQRKAMGVNNAGLAGKGALFLSSFPTTIVTTLRELTGTSDKFARPNEKIWSQLNTFTGAENLSGHISLFKPENSSLDFVNLANGQVEKSWKIEGDEPPLVVSTFDDTVLMGGTRSLEDSTNRITKIDTSGTEVWSTPISSHHQVNVAEDGFIYTPVIMPVHKQTQKLMPGDSRYRDDGYAILSPDGDIVEMGSLTQMLLDNDLGHLVYGVGALEWDGIHLNAVMPADSDTNYWKKGDLMMSIRHLSMLLIYRPSTKKIIWYKNGPWLNQHDPDFISSTEISVFGNDAVSVFGNRTSPKAPILEGGNKIYVYNFETDTVSTPFQDAMQQMDLETVTGGRHTILTDGSLFSVFSNAGVGALYNQADGSISYFGRKAAEGVLDLRSGLRIFLK